MKYKPTERAGVENPVVAWAKKNGCPEVYKMSTQFTRSWPDRLFFIPGGRPLLIEFKRAGCEPTEKQERKINELRKLGYDVQVCDNKEQGIALVRSRLEAATVHASRRKMAPGARRRGVVS